MLAAYYMLKTAKSNHRITKYYRYIEDRKPVLYRGISSKCRVCLREGDMCIYSRDNTQEIIEALKVFGNITLSENDHTKVLCSTCFEFVTQALLFRKIAMQSAELLKNTIKQETDDLSLEETSLKSYTSEESSLSEDESDDYSDINSENETLSKDVITKENLKKVKNIRVTNVTLEKVKKQKVIKEKKDVVKYNSKVTCHICSKVVNSSYYKQHVTMHEPDPNKYVCEVCGKSFRLQCAYRNHSLRHRTDFPFKCQLCPYRGRYKELLKMHMRTHTTDHRYMCTECPGRFRFKSNLNTHMQKHKVPQFKCNACKRAFHTKPMLDRHYEADHLGIKNHVCNICGKAFGYRNAMMKHQRLVHKREKLSYGRMPSYLQADNTYNASNSPEPA